MGQEDYILRQIDILGKVLGKVLADLLGLKNKGEIIEIESFSQILKSELDIDLERFFNFSDEDLFKFLIVERKFNLCNIEKIAEIFFVAGLDFFKSDDNNFRKYLKISLKLFEYMTISEGSYSVDRMKKIEKMKNLI